MAISMSIVDWSIWNLVPGNRMIAPEGSDTLLIEMLNCCSKRLNTSQLEIACASALFHCLQPQNDAFVRDLVSEGNLCGEAIECLIEVLSLRPEHVDFILAYLPDFLRSYSQSTRLDTWTKLVQQRQGPFQWKDSEILRLTNIVNKSV